MSATILALFRGDSENRRCCFAACCSGHLYLMATSAQSIGILNTDGEVTTTLSLSEADFKALPRINLMAKDEAGVEQNFEGVIFITSCARRNSAEGGA